MREIKFRFFSIDNRMIYEHDGWSEGIGINEAIKLSGDCGYKLMQYTGLKDKNGKEIYEGDIVTFWGGRGKVIYFDAYAAFKIQFQTENDLADLNLNSHEVLGNIYENAELIKV